METVIVLLGTFLLSLLILRIANKKYEVARAGRIGMSAMLVLTAIGHFMFAKGMAMMIAFLPFPVTLVYITGLIELAAAFGLLVPKISVLTGWLLIVFFVLLLPANIYAAYHHVNLKTADYTGEGLEYLYFRIPLQLIFIKWVHFFLIRNQSKIK